MLNCANLDADEVFAYNTVKLVRVKDRYLGLLRYIMLLGIFVYIVVFVLIMDQKYLAIEVPVGTVSTSLEKPAVETRVWEFPYCNSYTGGEKFYPLNCTVWDQYQAHFPPDELDSMFITTRVGIAEQDLVCSDFKHKACLFPWTRGTENMLYLAGIEKYTIRVEHSMQAHKFYAATGDSAYAAASSEMKGKLVDTNGNVLQRFGFGMDIISLQTWLQAADEDLDTETTAEGHDPGETKRHAGAVLLVFISYTNDGKTERPSYTYSASSIPGAEYKIVETERLTDTHRRLYNRHGTKLVFVITGSIGRFDFQVMLVQLVSALGLLSVATLIVEMLMLYVLPHRKYYSRYKFQETIDFSDVRDAEAEEREGADEVFRADLNQDLADLRRESMPINDTRYQQFP